MPSRRRRLPGEVYYSQAWVPVSDTDCWIYTYSWRPDRLSPTPNARSSTAASAYAQVGEDYIPVRNLRNDYLIDRGQQKTTSFTGIVGSQ